MMVTGDYMGNIITWVIQTGEKVMTIRNVEETSVEAILWLTVNQHNLILSGGSNGVLYVWHNLKLLCKLFEHREQVN